MEPVVALVAFFGVGCSYPGVPLVEGHDAVLVGIDSPKEFFQYTPGPPPAMGIDKGLLGNRLAVAADVFKDEIRLFEQMPLKVGLGGADAGQG